MKRNDSSTHSITDTSTPTSFSNPPSSTCSATVPPWFEKADSREPFALPFSLIASMKWLVASSTYRWKCFRNDSSP